MIDERLNFFIFCGVDNHALELVWGNLKEIGGCENGLLGNEASTLLQIIYPQLVKVYIPTQSRVSEVYIFRYQIS